VAASIWELSLQLRPATSFICCSIFSARPLLLSDVSATNRAASESGLDEYSREKCKREKRGMRAGGDPWGKARRSGRHIARQLEEQEGNSVACQPSPIPVRWTKTLDREQEYRPRAYTLICSVSGALPQNTESLSLEPLVWWCMCVSGCLRKRRKQLQCFISYHSFLPLLLYFHGGM